MRFRKRQPNAKHPPNMPATASGPPSAYDVEVEREMYCLPAKLGISAFTIRFAIVTKTGHFL
jgi:hypothetical protein